MSRVIKFRAWSPKWQQMVTPDNPHISIDVHAITLWKDASDDENPSLMQYTGLKDKNGVEIYEGDICLLDGWRIQSVEWVTDGFVLIESGTSYAALSYATSNDRHTLEVIGNIYENPELLDKAE